MAFALAAGLGLVGTEHAAASVVFQANTNNLHVYTGGQVSTDTLNGMAPGTSPSVATLANGERIIAFQANTSRLMIRRADGSVIDTTLGMKAGTSPSIAAAPNGGYMVAMQSNLGQLYTYTPATGGVNTQQGMLADTNPSIAALSDGTYRVAFQTNVTQLRVINGTGDPSTVVNTAYGMRDHTSPAIAAAPTGAGYAVAFQANTSALYTFTPTGGGVNTNQGMMAGTSPAIAWANGGFKVAFQTNITQLRVIDADGNPNSVNNPPFGLNTRTSPTIAPAGNGNVQVAFTANTNQLWTWTTGSSSGYNTLQGTNGLASPSIAFDAPTSFWFGGADAAVNTDAEADAVIAKLRSQSDADAPATWNGLTPTDQGFVRNRANATIPSSVTYGGANWKVTGANEINPLTTDMDNGTADVRNALWNGLSPDDRNALPYLNPADRYEDVLTAGPDEPTETTPLGPNVATAASAAVASACPQPYYWKAAARGGSPVGHYNAYSVDGDGVVVGGVAPFWVRLYAYNVDCTNGNSVMTFALERDTRNLWQHHVVTSLYMMRFGGQTKGFRLLQELPMRSYKPSVQSLSPFNDTDRQVMYRPAGTSASLVPYMQNGRLVIGPSSDTLVKVRTLIAPMTYFAFA